MSVGIYKLEIEYRRLNLDECELVWWGLQPYLWRTFGCKPTDRERPNADGTVRKEKRLEKLPPELAAAVRQAREERSANGCQKVHIFQVPLPCNDKGCGLFDYYVLAADYHNHCDPPVLFAYSDNIDALLPKGIIEFVQDSNAAIDAAMVKRDVFAVITSIVIAYVLYALGMSLLMGYMIVQPEPSFKKYGVLMYLLYITGLTLVVLVTVFSVIHFRKKKGKRLAEVLNSALNRHKQTL